MSLSRSMRRSASHRFTRRFLMQSTAVAALASPLAMRDLASHDARNQVSPEASPMMGHDHAAGMMTMPPEMAWTWTDAGAEHPMEVTAGWNHVKVTNNSSNLIHVASFRLPDDVTLEQAGADMAGSGPLPEWFFRAYFPGIPDNVVPGGMIDGYTFYHEGNYLWVQILNNGFANFGAFTVVPGSFNRIITPANVRLDMVEMTYMGLEAPLAVGMQSWQVANHGATWHEVMILQSPELMTVDEVIALIGSTDNAEILPEGYTVRGGYGVTSPGTTGYVTMDLPAGNYAAICFVPENFDGPPHALMGMIMPFTVE